MSTIETRLGFASIALTDSERALVQTVRDFARAEPFAPSADSPTRGGFDRAFSEQIAALGWVGMTIPAEYGGSARSGVERCLVISELLAAGAPLGAHWTADRQTAPSLLINGPESLRQELLPRIAAGRCLMAGGFSEPEAGSDLASVRTRARRVEGGWRITGRKIWTTDAHRADYIEVLCRTADTERKHEGLSLIVVPMNAPGIEVRPIEGMDGERHFNEVVLDDVFAADGWLIGAEGSGWQQLTAELALERAGPERYLTTFPLFEAFVASREQTPDPAAHQLIGSVVAQQMGLREMSLSIARLVDHGGSPIAEAAMAKDLGTELEQLLVDELWSYGAEPLRPGPAAERFHTLLDINRLRSPVFTTAGGTNEVLRMLVARQLPGWAAGRRATVLRSPVAETVHDLAVEASTKTAARSVPRGEVDPVSLRLLDELAASGFLGVGVAESVGGGGGNLADALDAIAGAGYAGTTVPILEGPILAGWLLAKAGIEFPWSEQLAVHASGDLTARRAPDGRVQLDGMLYAVRWGTRAALLVVPVLHGGTVYVATLARPQDWTEVAEIAGTPSTRAITVTAAEPRHFVDTGLSPAQVAATLDRRAALGNSVAMSAALQRTAELTIGYGGQRVQFGQPINRFQAVQAHLTRLASEAQRASVMVDAARARTDDDNAPPFGPVAAARALTGNAAIVAGRTAHQVHGAIGVTMEYALQRYSRRLWELALADRTTAWWERELGARACAADLGAWQLITDTDRAR